MVLAYGAEHGYDDHRKREVILSIITLHSCILISIGHAVHACIPAAPSVLPLPSKAPQSINPALSSLVFLSILYSLASALEVTRSHPMRADR